jgi:class 3 adenylate cyclase
MALNAELTAAVKKTFKEEWTKREGVVVPESEDIGLGNEAVLLDATVLYADLAGSTAMVQSTTQSFSAEVYKTYLYCAARIVRSEGGAITAYDGDRIMAVFIGESRNTSAARCGLKINYAVREIINPAIAAQYPKTDFRMRQVVGVDSSSLWVARTGVRGANDLVWVGRAANYAAKLTEIDDGHPTWITAEVYNKLNKSTKVSRDGRDMWERRSWNAMGGATVYRSSWWWRID